MKHYLGLVSEYEKVHKKKSRISLLCIAISVCLVTAIFSMADMAIRSQINYFIKSGGNYHIMLADIDEETAASIGNRVEIAISGWMLQGSSGSLQGKLLVFAGANKDVFTETTEMNLIDGIYPVTTNEALLNKSAIEQLGLSISDTVTVTVPNGIQKDYTIVGVCEDLGTLLQADAYGMILSEEGFRIIADENAKDGSRYRIQFKDGVNIQNTITDIKATFQLSNNQIAENTTLLGLMGQSKSNIMQSLYHIALILVLLVLVAGTVMISASFNINVIERTQFYGLLRCLGASKKQIKRFVIVQGLRQSIKGVPLGLIIGQLITWGACALLQHINSSRFTEIPQFKFSTIGIIAGVVVGFLIVLLAALSPAKKAAKVSPLVAVSGNSQLQDTHKTTNTNLFHVETGMGISHAFSSKKNIMLMTCSFAISIVLFLSFQVMVTFLNQAMPALRSSVSDITITVESGTTLSTSLAEEIQFISGVKRVYGRMIANDIPISSDNGDGVITLITYEGNQFNWIESELTQGNVENVRNGQNSVLTVFQNTVSWNIGDKITIMGAPGSKIMTVEGVISTINEDKTKNSIGYLVCSEQTFLSLVGDSGYSVINVQLANIATDNTVSEIRSLLPVGASVSDKRLSNSEAQDSYYTGAIFIYGFLLIIALITVFNIFNSMNASVLARTKQYGIMRSIGMSTRQLYKMIAAEAVIYAALGCIVGCVLGLPLNKAMFEWLITGTWGIVWQLPVKPLFAIIILCLISVVISILRPIRQIRNMTIVDALKIQQ